MAYTNGMIAELIKAFGDQSFTWKEAKIHFATLNAAATRGLLNKTASGQYVITPAGKNFAKVIEQDGKNKDRFVVFFRSERFPCLCYRDGMKIEGGANDAVLTDYADILRIERF